MNESWLVTVINAILKTIYKNNSETETPLLLLCLLHPPYSLLLYLPSGGAGQLPEKASVTPDKE